MWSLYRPRSAAKPHDGSHRAKHRRVTSWTAKVQRVQRSTGPPWPTFRLVHLLHRSGFKLWSLKVSKYEVVCRVYKKVSSGWISDMTLTFFAMISRLYIGSIGSLSKAFSLSNPSPASNALVLGSQVLRCAKLRACFNIFLVSDIFVKQRRIHVAAKGSPPVWRPEPRKTGLDVSNSQNKLDVPWFPSP